MKWHRVSTRRTTQRFAGCICCSLLVAFACVAGSQFRASAKQLTGATQQTNTSNNSQTRLANLRKLIASGHPQQAFDQAEQWRSADPTVPGLDVLEGDALYDLNRLPEADAAYVRALALDPHDGAAAQMRGLTLFKLGRPKDALPWLEINHAVGAQSKADPTYVLALCYMDTLRYDDARKAFATQFGVPPESAAAYLLAARMLQRREFKPVAKQDAEKALALQPNLPGAHILLGELALAQNHLDDAIAEFGKERELNPLGGVAYERMGDAYTRAGNYTDAERVPATGCPAGAQCHRAIHPAGQGVC